MTEEVSSTTEEVSPMTEDVSSTTEEGSPMTEEGSPMTEEVSSMTEEFSPITEELSPVTEEFSPMPEEFSPMTEEVAPMIEEDRFENGLQKPIPENRIIMIAALLFPSTSKNFCLKINKIMCDKLDVIKVGRCAMADQEPIDVKDIGQMT